MALECSDGYDQLVSGSDNCFKIVKERQTWKKAEAECKKDNATLACFANERERDILTSQCELWFGNGCWVGYTWKEGGSTFRVYVIKFYFFHLIIFVVVFRIMEAYFSGNDMSQLCCFRMEKLEEQCWTLCKNLVHIIQ